MTNILGCVCNRASFLSNLQIVVHFFNLKAPDTILSRKLDFEKDEKMHRITEDMCQEMYANG